jgi:hypothetical protein
MDTLTRLFFSDIKAEDTPKEHEVMLTRAGIPDRYRGRANADAVHIEGTGVSIPFRKRKWISHGMYQALVISGFHFVVLQERH